MQNKSKHLLILASVAVIFILAALFSGPTNQDIEGSGDYVFPNLLSKVNDVSYLKIEKNDGTLTLTKEDDEWTVKENDHYPAAIDKIRQLVLGIGNMKRVEPKTANPEHYQQLGLQDVSKKGAKSTHVVLIAGKDKKLADLIIGDSKPSQGDPTKKSYYIRTKDDPQSWLVNANLPDQWQPKDWLDIDVFEVKRDRIQQVKVSHPDGEVVYIHRDSPAVRDFTLESLKPGEKVTAPYEVNNIATTFTKMTFDDVVSDNTAKVDKKPFYTAVLKTFDGLEVTFEPHKAGEKYLTTYRAKFDENFAKQWREKLEQQQNNNKQSESGSKEKSGSKASLTAALKSADEVKQEVESYDDLWDSWMYQLPNFRIKNIGKKKADLLAKESAKPIH